MNKTLIGFLCFCLLSRAQAKLGETVPQLEKRFGKSYTVERIRGGEKYKFRSANVSVDAFLVNGTCVAETYFSDHPLGANGEPPNDIVRAVLKTNVPGARWVEVDSASFTANYALESSDHKYVAFLRYKGPQPENMLWTMTVARRETWAYAEPKPQWTTEGATPSPGEGQDATAVSKSGMPSLPWETPSSRVLTVFINHVSDIESLYRRPMSKNDGEWVYAADRVARTAADYAVGVDLVSRLHWQPQDANAIKSYLGYVRQMLTVDLQTLDAAVSNSQLAVIREEARSLRNDIRTFDSFIASMTATVSALPSATPSGQTDFQQRRDRF